MTLPKWKLLGEKILKLYLSFFRDSVFFWLDEKVFHTLGIEYSECVWNSCFLLLGCSVAMIYNWQDPIFKEGIVDWSFALIDQIAKTCRGCVPPGLIEDGTNCILQFKRYRFQYLFAKFGHKIKVFWLTW